MASTDLTSTAQHSEKEDRLNAKPTDLAFSDDVTSGVTGSSEEGKGSVERSPDVSPASQSSVSGLSSTKLSPASVGSTDGPPLSMPHPKKFSHVNINKKFLEKTSASTPAHTLSASPTPRTANSSQKPVTQATGTHPRLITAKLTATPHPSSTGRWSRPSSAVPSSAPTPLPAPSLQTSSVSATTATVVPLLPHVGKVIQPQPRSGQVVPLVRKDSSARSVWGNTKGGVIGSSDRVHADFPTAAEVAQGRITKSLDRNSSTDAAAAHKQAVISELMAEEDTFRGVHLDPNTHHWDEMEEDDDNFLGGVIEFGDGRQYKVQPSEIPRQSSPQRNVLKSSFPDQTDSSTHGLTDHPVSKEERFEDDFDRSWPRSRPGFSQAPGQYRDQRSAGSVTSPTLPSVHSPQESSRVLFNERSNRLEPYSHQRHGPGVPSHLNRRSSRSDNSVSPTEPRRDPPPHTELPSVQLLQKSPNPPHADSLAISQRERSPTSPPDGSRLRDRHSIRREHISWQSNGALEPTRPGPFGGSHSSGHPPRDVALDDRVRRPPAVDTSVGFGSSHRRQLPPHLSAPSVRHVPPIRTDQDVLPSFAPPPNPAQSEPSAPSASSQAADSPAVPPSALPASDVEDIRKAAMHSAAERARLRRQQEEEEREKEKDRARRKAAEIEARMRVAEQAKTLEREYAEAEKQRTDVQVLGIIEEAVSSVSLSKEVEHLDAALERARPALGRGPSTRGTSRPFAARRASLTAMTPSPVSDTDTWRRKPGGQESRAPPILPPTVLAHAELEVKEGEEVDVVDFADLGKLVDPEPASQQTCARPSRAQASDFFNDEAPLPHRPPPPPSKADEGPWRRHSSLIQGQTLPEKLERPSLVSDNEDIRTTVHIPSAESSRVHPVATAVVTQPALHEDQHRRLSGQYQGGMHKPASGPHYREAPMSTLNDTMARIKGAIDGMHTEEEVPKELPNAQKWLPPALRTKAAHPDCAHITEVFDITATEPPNSPKRAWNIFTVKIAHDARPVPPPPKVEYVWARGQRYFRLDAYSWNPPIEVLNRRDMTFNDYLYGGPRMYKGHPKYFVSIPKTNVGRRLSAEATPAPPVVNLPTTPPRLRNGSTKDNVASSWRKPPVSPTVSWRSVAKESAQEMGLDTVSRSPPPEAPSTKATAPVSVVDPSLATPSTAAQPKSSVGSDVTFYRAARVEPSAEPMKFVVGSELESGSRLGLITSGMGPIATSAATSSAPAHPAVLSIDTRIEVPSALGHELLNGTSTPLQSGLSQWPKSPKAFSVKESPARAPDPEHLKAVWSQTSDKAQIQPVNSLKSIADDLTSVPFLLQDVKSDDGETPPPSGSGPWTRMSAYEVTRAFQQVPTSSSTSSQHLPSIASPTASMNAANGTPPRNPSFAFSPPPLGQPSLRPAYPYSPMMSTPSPAVMYSHPSPVPRPMVVNGSAPGYGQPVWMSAMPGPPPPQPTGMMRSPYPAHLVPYPSPGGAVPMYPAPMPGMHNPTPAQNGGQGRPPGMSLVSPVMQPALPQMYAGSPVLVPAPSVIPPGPTYPAPGHPNRGPMRPYEQNPGAPHMPSPMRQPTQNGYNPIQSNFARPSW